MTKTETFDFAIVGGGVIGLSIAWQLSHYGKVVLVERHRIGREASWAGAGILPPSSMAKAIHPIEQLAARSFHLHDEWALRLESETGIDTGFRRCGAVFVARTVGEFAALAGQRLEWSENDVQTELINNQRLVELIPSMSSCLDSIQSAVFVPQEAQIRNPDHLRALRNICQLQGVQFLEEQGDCRLQVSGDSVSGIQTEKGQPLLARRFCLAAGAWTQQLCEQIDVRISTLPVRGQMLLFKLPQRIFEPILYEGTRYVVPRDDGHVVVGATLEEAGFDKSTTEEGVGGLRKFAGQLIPELNEHTLIDSWAGLRPASYDGFPYIGPVPHLKNVWVATAHFRAGLLLSTGTAELIGQMMRDEITAFDTTPFRIDRG